MRTPKSWVERQLDDPAEARACLDEAVKELGEYFTEIAAWRDVATMFRAAADGEDDGGRAVKAIEMFNSAVQLYGHPDYGPEGHPLDCTCGDHDRDPQEPSP